MTILLTALVLVLCAHRDPGPEARTPAQMWAGVRALGWRRATGRGLAGFLIVAVLVLGCMAIAGIGVTLRVLAGVSLVIGTVGWHLADLVDWKPVRLMESR